MCPLDLTFIPRICDNSCEYSPLAWSAVGLYSIPCAWGFFMSQHGNFLPTKFVPKYSLGNFRYFVKSFLRGIKNGSFGRGKTYFKRMEQRF
nr:MAG TPA: hypothetical protein [Caudoviricetes sp.]